MCQDDKLCTRQALRQIPPDYGRNMEGCRRAESSEEKTMIGYLRSLTILGGVLEFIGKFEPEVVKGSQKLGK